MSNHRSSRPKFDELPLRDGDPQASAWGLWGEDDELGTLNLLEPGVVREAAKDIKTGETVTLRSAANAHHLLRSVKSGKAEKKILACPWMLSCSP
jgi:hypothetical protein